MKGWVRGEREGEVRGWGEGQRGKERGAWSKDGSGGMRSEGWRAEWELRGEGEWHKRWKIPNHPIPTHLCSSN